VIIPCHNAEQWIEETLSSALGQEGVTVEVIVVDDGSTDGSVALISGAFARQVILIEQAWAGVSRARSVGTARAAGAFVQYLDADDVLLPGTLLARVAALDATGADVAYSDWVRYELGAGGDFLDGPVISRRLGHRPDLELFTDAWWPPGALLYRRAIVDRIGCWREDLPIIQDARFQLDAALQRARFVPVGDVGLRYRVHGGTSLSRRDPRAFLEDCYRNARDVHTLWTAEGPLDPDRRLALLKVYGYLARGFCDVDRARFEEVTRLLYQLAPSYLPEGHRLLRLASRLVGYPRAERMASVWRRVGAHSASE
jgi:glycosyltransferase involved in cell wall biosynthesis